MGDVGGCRGTGVRRAAGTERLLQQLLLTAAANKHTRLRVSAVVCTRSSFHVHKAHLAHMRNEVVPQPVMAKKTHRSL